MLSQLLLDEDTSRLTDEQRLTREANLGAIMDVFPRLRFGLDVNVRFSAIDAFEFTAELATFDLFHIEYVEIEKTMDPHSTDMLPCTSKQHLPWLAG